MIFGHESISQFTRSNLLLWLTLAFQAGLLNMGGFMACHRFVSHVTGFATFFGAEFAQFQLFEASGMLFVPLSFLFGVMISGYLVDLRLKQGKPPKYYISFGVIFLINIIVLVGGLLGFFGEFGEPLQLSRDYMLLLLLCLVCGIQNGTVTTVSKSVVRTTHLTGITTDLGIGLVRYLNRDKLNLDWHQENWANATRAGLILFFGLGSVAGAFMFKNFHYLGFVIPSLISGGLFALMIYFQRFKKV